MRLGPAVLLVALTGRAPSLLSAQSPTPPRARVGPTVAGLTVGLARVPVDRPRHVRMSPADEPGQRTLTFGVRTLTGAVGAVAGGVGGAILGAQVFGRNSGGEDPGLTEGLIGAAVGAALGAGLGAAIPERGAACSAGRRLGLGFAGASAGALLGALAGGRSAVVLIVVPGAAALGAAGAITLCR